jgi:hypothetical protein
MLERGELVLDPALVDFRVSFAGIGQIEDSRSQILDLAGLVAAPLDHQVGLLAHLPDVQLFIAELGHLLRYVNFFLLQLQCRRGLHQLSIGRRLGGDQLVDLLDSRSLHRPQADLAPVEERVRSELQQEISLRHLLGVGDHVRIADGLRARTPHVV